MIDIAGFTRITENSIRHAIELSNLPINDFVACKEYNENNRPYMHMYVEMERNALMSHAISVDILKEHLSIYFKYIDNDYTDLKKILGIDPLEITIVKCGTFDMYEIMKALYDIDFDGPIRPDHGRMIWDEVAMPGYGLYDRALGATYLNGLWEAIVKGEMKK